MKVYRIWISEDEVDELIRGITAAMAKKVVSYDGHFWHLRERLRDIKKGKNNDGGEARNQGSGSVGRRGR